MSELLKDIEEVIALSEENAICAVIVEESEFRLCSNYKHSIVDKLILINQLKSEDYELDNMTNVLSSKERLEKVAKLYRDLLALCQKLIIENDTLKQAMYKASGHLTLSIEKTN